MKYLLSIVMTITALGLLGCSRQEPEREARAVTMPEVDDSIPVRLRTFDGIRHFDHILPEYTETISKLPSHQEVGLDGDFWEAYDPMHPDGSWWHTLHYRARDDEKVSRDEIMARLRSVFVSNAEWRISDRQATNFGAVILSIGEDDIWCELIPWYSIWDRDIWCFHVSDDARSVCVYTRAYWGLPGRQKPKEDAPTRASTATKEAASGDSI